MRYRNPPENKNMCQYLITLPYIFFCVLVPNGTISPMIYYKLHTFAEVYNESYTLYTVCAHMYEFSPEKMHPNLITYKSVLSSMCRLWLCVHSPHNAALQYYMRCITIVTVCHICTHN